MLPAPYRRSRLYYWRPENWQRSLRNHVPQKALRDVMNRLRFGDAVPPSDSAVFVRNSDLTLSWDRAASPVKLWRRDSCRVVPGDWDRYRKPGLGGLRMESCRMRYLDGADWEETPQYQRMMMLVGRGERPAGCRNPEDVKQRYEALDRMVAETRARGRFLTREELPDCFRREHGGILVSLAGDGVLLRTGGGGHRFAIAKVLDLPEVPVQLGAIHPDALRDGHLAALRREPSVGVMD
jgi:hypothetical protein